AVRSERRHLFVVHCGGFVGRWWWSWGLGLFLGFGVEDVFVSWSVGCGDVVDAVVGVGGDGVWQPPGYRVPVDVVGVAESAGPAEVAGFGLLQAPSRLVLDAMVVPAG